jgi:hypothetical protein
VRIDDIPGISSENGLTETLSTKRPQSEKQREALGAHAFQPGTNSLSGETHRRAEDNARRSATGSRDSKRVAKSGGHGLLRFAEFACDTLEGKPQVADASRLGTRTLLDDPSLTDASNLTDEG